jgi:hypothetical protein
MKLLSIKKNKSLFYLYKPLKIALILILSVKKINSIVTNHMPGGTTPTLKSILNCALNTP